MKSDGVRERGDRALAGVDVVGEARVQPRDVQCRLLLHRGRRVGVRRRDLELVGARAQRQLVQLDARMVG